MLAPYEDKSAYAQCIFSYSPGPGSDNVKLFVGRCPGKIVPARGSKAFGYDVEYLESFLLDGIQSSNQMDLKQHSPRWLLTLKIPFHIDPSLFSCFALTSQRKDDRNNKILFKLIYLELCRGRLFSLLP